MSAVYTHRFTAYGGAVVQANEQNTAARVTWPGENAPRPREFTSEPAKAGQPQPEPTATMQAMLAAKEAMREADAESAMKRQDARQKAVDAARERLPKTEPTPAPAAHAPPPKPQGKK